VNTKRRAIADLVAGNISFSIRAPVVLDRSRPSPPFWSTVEHAAEAVRSVVAPFVERADEVRIYSLGWTSTPSMPAELDLFRGIERCTEKHPKGGYLKVIDRELILAQQRLWFGGGFRLFSAFPVVLMNSALLAGMGDVFQKCALIGAVSGANRGGAAPAVRAAKEAIKAQRVAVIFRDEEIEIFVPTEFQSNFVDCLLQCMTIPELVAKLRELPSPLGSVDRTHKSEI
jgi:hypothetical protein